jgi:hypothetical protein
MKMHSEARSVSSECDSLASLTSAQTMPGTLRCAYSKHFAKLARIDLASISTSGRAIRRRMRLRFGRRAGGASPRDSQRVFVGGESWRAARRSKDLRQGASTAPTAPPWIPCWHEGVDRTEWISDSIKLRTKVNVSPHRVLAHYVSTLVSKRPMRERTALLIAQLGLRDRVSHGRETFCLIGTPSPIVDRRLSMAYDLQYISHRCSSIRPGWQSALY